MPSSLTFVTAVSDWEILSTRLARSACLRQPHHRWHLQCHARSAAEVFNASMAVGATTAGPDDWVVWVHQDVVLPPGWDTRFVQAIAEAQARYPKLEVVGVYGLNGTGEHARRVGHVLDRGLPLREPTPMPSLVDSLDELLFAVRASSQLRLDPTLGFDFYATDLVLQAQQRGSQAAVVNAYCEHWSGTPRTAPFARGFLERVVASGSQFETKWAHRLPITTPIIHLEQPGDTRRLAERLLTAPPLPTFHP